MDINPITCTVIGLGKLGLPLAGLLSDRGLRVKGYDFDVTRMKNIKKLNLEPEPGLKDLISDNFNRNLTLHGNLKSALLESSATFIVVPTPSKEDGKFDNKYVTEAIKGILSNLELEDSKHVICVVSTVMPGTCTNEFLPLINKIYNGRVGLVYSPEFIAIGSIIKNMEYPDQILIGEDISFSGEMIESILTRIVKAKVPVLRMSLSSSELVKIATNSYVTMKISFANFLAEIADKIDSVDSNIVARSLGLDSRIGTKYLKPGLGFGGPCFPRDNRAFSSLADSFGLSADLARATDKINIRQIEKVFHRIIQNFSGPNVRIAFLGVAYKSGTHIVEESQALELANTFARNGYQISVHDKLALKERPAELEAEIQILESLSSLETFDAIIVALDCEVYKEIEDLYPEKVVYRI